MGLRFTGVIKTGMHGFPYSHLTLQQFGGRGKWCGYFHQGDSSLSDLGMLAVEFATSSNSFVQRMETSQQNAKHRAKLRSIVISQPNCSKN